MTAAEARRLAVRAQALDGTGRDILGVLHRIGFLQLDPTNRIAPSHLLVLWSRLGPFDPEELDRLLWQERRLFEWRAFIHPTEDYPLVKRDMLRFPGDAGAWQRRVGTWLRDNEPFRRYILRELRARGPRKSRELEDRAVKPWPSSGWSKDRNVTQMLSFMNARGEIFVTRREGGQRVWDLPDRVLPASVLKAPPVSDRTAARRRLRTLGIVRPSAAYRGVGERVRVSHVSGEWVADPDALDSLEKPLPPRMTFLSPFDRLIYDRERTEDLFGFRYRTEIYVPKARREFGFYAMPILLGDRLVGRVDAGLERKAGVLHVHAVHRERGTRVPPQELRKALLSLGDFLGASRVEGA